MEPEVNIQFGGSPQTPTYSLVTPEGPDPYPGYLSRPGTGDPGEGYPSGVVVLLRSFAKHF